jgi:hypothetical protein
MLASLAVDPQPWRDASKVSARMATVVVAVRLIGKASRHSHRPESTRPSCPAGCVPLHREAVPEFRFIPPCSPKPAKAVPAGAGFDGYRVQAHKVGSRVVLFSRNGHDFTDRFPSIAQLLHLAPQ